MFKMSMAKEPIGRVVVAADGTGDTTDIQTGLDMLSNYKGVGGEVYIKEGTYTITSTITIPNNNITLRGSGKATKIVTTSNIIMIYASSKDDLIIRDLYLYGNGVGAFNDGGGLVGCWSCEIIY